MVELNYLPNLLHQVAEKMLVGSAGAGVRSSLSHRSGSSWATSIKYTGTTAILQSCVFGFNSWFLSSFRLIYRSQDKTFNKAFREQNVEAEVLPQKSNWGQKHLICTGSSETQGMIQFNNDLLSWKLHGLSFELTLCTHLEVSENVVLIAS